MISQKKIPVVDKNNNPLMPTIIGRAISWNKSGKGTFFKKKGFLAIRLNVAPSNNKNQNIAVGIDPGSKKEAFTVKSEAHTYLNIQADARTGTREKIKSRRGLRVARRHRKCRRRPIRCSNRLGRSQDLYKVRWNWKLRILEVLAKCYPITDVIVEDVKAKSKKNCRKWNRSFSPVQTGKNYFYSKIKKSWNLYTKKGYETKELRESLELKKSKYKNNSFNAHCVDSWVLANSVVGGHGKVDNAKVLLLVPLNFRRRQLHYMVPKKGGVRGRHGGTISLGIKRGTLIKHLKWGVAYVGGTAKERLSLHDINKKRMCLTAKKEECKLLTTLAWMINNVDKNSTS